MSKRKSNDYADFLALLAKHVSSFGEEDIKRVVSGEFELKVNLVKRKSLEVDQHNDLTFDIQNIVKMLESIEDREHAKELLKGINKKHLEVIARSLDIAIQRIDKIEVVRNKIIEATVGARLRSIAIQGPR